MRTTRLARLLTSFALLAVIAIPIPVAASHPTTSALPDLGMAPLSDFSIQRRAKGQRWLRFSAVIVNVGSAPFQALGFDRDATGQLKVDQEIPTSAGWIRHPTAAAMYWSGDGHSHWHVRDLEEYVLESQNGTTRRYGEKDGFCFWDNYRYNLALPGAPTTAQYTSSNSCGTSSANTTVRMGLSIGWGDIYPSTIADQYIDISNLPAGEYTVTATADWADWFDEEDETNNSTTARIRISKNSVTVLDPGTGP